jgi:DNA (cytosine-5)-methyltransferase 1
MNFIDLFAGAGGLSEGFIRAGFNPVAHVESDNAACFTLKTRVAFHYLKKTGKHKTIYKMYLEGVISRSQLYSYVPEKIMSSVINTTINTRNNKGIFKKIHDLKEDSDIDVIVGGPPCQAYSVVGRSRDKKGMKGDPRNYLYKHYAKYLKEFHPKVFVFENVMGLLSADNGRYLRNMKNLFDKVGYDCQLRILNARDFGVLQNRKRILIIGWKKKLKFSYPNLKVKKDNYFVKEIFTDLPSLFAGEGLAKGVKYKTTNTKYLKNHFLRNGIEVLTQHVTRPHTEQDKEIYRIAVEKWKEKERLTYSDLPARLITHKNTKSFLDRFKVVAEDLDASQTVVAHIAKDGHHYIHPDINQNRSISVREAARLQSFPDDYYFEGENEKSFRTAAFKQIGNAVPPLMANSIAKAVKKHLQVKQ